MHFGPPPKVIKTEVFASMPAHYRRTGHQSRWADANRAAARIDCFIEGPAFDREGNLYIVDTPYGRLFKITPDGTFNQVAEYDGWPYSIKFHKDGRGFITDHMHGIMVFDPKSGDVKPFLDSAYTEKFKGVNDLAFASNGDMYFTDQGQTGLHDPTGRVYRLSANGRLDRLLSNVPSPNGLVLSPDEKFLYLAVTRSISVWRVPLMTDGNVSKVGTFAQLSGGVGPDGMAVDEEGNVVVVHFGFGVVWVFNKKGVPLYQIDSCAGDLVTNAAYGCRDRRSMFITVADGVVLRAEMPVAGLPLYSHA